MSQSFKRCPWSIPLSNDQCLLGNHPGQGNPHPTPTPARPKEQRTIFRVQKAKNNLCSHQPQWETMRHHRENSEGCCLSSRANSLPRAAVVPPNKASKQALKGSYCFQITASQTKHSNIYRDTEISSHQLKTDNCAKRQGTTAVIKRII